MARKLSLDLETETLEQTDLKHNIINCTTTDTETLEQTEIVNSINNQTELVEKVPVLSPITKQLPSIGHPENVVVIDGISVEIKPTKYKYFRNKFTNYYKYLKEIPVSDFLNFAEGTFGADNRSGDQVVFDFLCAVFDDDCFVQDHYDNMDADILEKILEIYGRVNHIKDKEENAKNRQAQTTA